MRKINLRTKLRRMLSEILCIAIVITILPSIPVKAEVTTERYPYTLFASSNEEAAITINANSFCVNGSIATNGTIVSSGNMNINGTKKEHNNEDMIYIFEKIDSTYFTDSIFDEYSEDYVLDKMNININTPLETEGKAMLTGNININSALKAYGDITLNGEVLNSNRSLLFSKYGDIVIDSQNVNLNELVYAPFGDVVITAQNLNLNNVVIIANTITFNCPNVNANYSNDSGSFVGNISEPIDIPNDEWKYMIDENENNFPDFFEDYDNWSKLNDTDADKVPNCVEEHIGTNPESNDTDDDGYDDYYEFFESDTDPLAPNSIDVLLQDDYDDLEMGLGVGDSYNSINGNVTFPEMCENGSTVSWEISNENIINGDGVVNRNLDEATALSCIARISLFGKAMTKEFSLLVMPKSNIDPENIGDLSIYDLEKMNVNDKDYYININDYGYIDKIYGSFSNVNIKSAETALYSLYNLKTALGLENPFEELVLYDVNVDESGSIFKFKQIVNGIPCYDNNIVISCDTEGKSDYLLSNYFPIENSINNVPNILYDVINSYIYEEYPTASIDDAPENEQLYVFNYYGKATLAWKKYIYTNDGAFEILINAENGNIVYKNALYNDADSISKNGTDILGNDRDITVTKKKHLFSKTEYFLKDKNRNINIYDAGGTTEWGFFDSPNIIENKDNNWTEEQVSAMANMEDIYDFYLNTFDRISYDDAWWTLSGNDIDVYLNTGLKDNAYWSGNKNIICIGVGNATMGTFDSISLAAGADVLCHEFTHAVVQNETSLDKIYYGTPGAINEGYADLFACFFDNDWKIGENVTIGDCLRNIETPNLTDNPASVGDTNYIDYKVKTYDKAGVHTNSTLISHTAYLMYKNGMDMDTLKSIWYKSLCIGYSKHTDFYDVRLNVLKAAKKLKLSDEEKNIINVAFDLANILKSNCDETNKSYFKDLDKKIISAEFIDAELYITGKIVEADNDTNISNNAVLSNISVSVNNVFDTENYSATDTDSSGLYNVDVGFQYNYMIKLEDDRYLTEEYYINDVNTLQTELYCETIELIPESKDGIGGATGKIISASSGKRVSGLDLYIRKGINNIYADIITTSYTNESGKYEITSLPAGNYTVEIIDNREEIKDKDKCISTYMNIKILGDTVINEQNGVVSTGLEKNQVRVVLTWGASPRDLDSHLISNENNNYFHVYYGDKTFYQNGELVCMLDLDDTTSYGPETVSLYNPLVGTYNYYVDIFSGESSFSASEACVRVYTGGDTHPSYTFNVPKSTGKKWDVFTYNSATKTVLPINKTR